MAPALAACGGVDADLHAGHTQHHAKQSIDRTRADVLLRARPSMQTHRIERATCPCHLAHRMSLISVIGRVVAPCVRACLPPTPKRRDGPRGKKLSSCIRAEKSVCFAAGACGSPNELVSAPGVRVASTALGSGPTTVDLSKYSRVARYDLPEPTRTSPPDSTSLLAQEASSVTYDWDTDTLFVVGDGGTSIVTPPRQQHLLGRGRSL